MPSSSDCVTIGGASGYWGDAAHATPQLLADGDLDYLVYDYLAEITMAILSRARAREPTHGYANDFVTAAMAPNLRDIARRKVRVVSNAGGTNPEACADALRTEIARQGLSLAVSVVTGDDLMPRLPALADQAPSEMFSGAPFPDPSKVASINAYLGAFPIAMALDSGADIVVTGRCVDSAVTLGACIHAFGWKPDAFDQLAGGSLAGHILECGAQATGGNFTDWHLVPDGGATTGYPIADVRPDGSFDIRKPEQSGGLVTPATVGEQMLYEIGDPQSYLLPDVCCDFSHVTLKQAGSNRVRVAGARGRGAPGSYKTCLTWANGFRGGHLFGYYGLDAEAKAQTFADAAIVRARRALRAANMADFTETSTEIIGSEAQFGAMRQSPPSREVTVKIAVKHAEARGVGTFLKEATGLALAAPPGLCGFAGARPKPSPVLALFSFLTPKAGVDIRILDGETEMAFRPPDLPLPADPERPAPPPMPKSSGDLIEVPLVDLAWGRSGDKGDKVNIGLIAREPEYLPYVWNQVTQDLLLRVFGHFLKGGIDRYFLPGARAMNIVLHDVLGGGGTSSLRNDPQGKGYAQLLLAAPVNIDPALLKDRP